MQIDLEKEITLRAYHEMFGGRVAPKSVNFPLACFEIRLKDGESIWATKVVPFGMHWFRVLWKDKAWTLLARTEMSSFNAQREERDGMEAEY